MEDKRRFTRAVFDGDATLEVADQKLEVVLSDLSLRGALLELPPDASFAPGTSALLTLVLEDTDIAIPLQCKISHATAGRAGVEFMLVDVEAMQHLRRLVELNLGSGGEHELGNLATDNPS